MKVRQKIMIWGLVILLGIGLLLGGIALFLHLAVFDFAREVAPQEKALRLQVVQTAENWLGCKESDGSHKSIIDIYNAYRPLAVDYTVQYTDEWCATFGSAVAIRCGLTEIIPTECGCQRQIELFRSLGCWQEDDAYVPLPGDYIFYSTGNRDMGDCTAWSDHVGIVVGTNGRWIKVIEGNNNEAVRYRILPIDDMTIRGFGLPNYAKSAN